MNDVPGEGRNANPYLALGVPPVHQLRQRAHPAQRQPDAAGGARGDRSGVAQFVGMEELMEAAGRRIAELTGAEWGLVTCGSAAALSWRLPPASRATIR